MLAKSEWTKYYRENFKESKKKVTFLTIEK